MRITQDTFGCLKHPVCVHTLQPLKPGHPITIRTLSSVPIVSELYIIWVDNRVFCGNTSVLSSEREGLIYTCVF